MNPNKRGTKYDIKCKKDQDVYLQIITMIEPAIGWIEILSVPEARVHLVASQIELAWLTKYPLSSLIRLQ